MSMYQKHVFAFWGAPEGGKTTLAVNMAVVLADSGYMTCLVSASDHGELQAFFNDNIPHDKGLYAAISNGRNVRDALVETRPNLCLLELDTGGDAYDIADITPDQVKKIIAELRDQFSYVIIDCTNYKESVFTGVGLVEADKIVLCVPHRTTASTWHFANAQMIDALASKIFFVDADTREGGTNMNQLFASMGLRECDISINYVKGAYECENFGTPIVLQSGRAERKYKDRVLALIKVLLEIENEEKKTAKENREKREKGLFKKPDAVAERKAKLDAPGIRSKPLSTKARKRAEDEAMRRAEEAAAGLNASDNEDDDED